LTWTHRDRYGQGRGFGSEGVRCDVSSNWGTCTCPQLRTARQAHLVLCIVSSRASDSGLVLFIAPGLWLLSLIKSH
jgi:hypothetical protein